MYGIIFSPAPMCTALETTRRSARHANILVSMNILFIRLLQYALVLATDSVNENTNLCSGGKKKVNLHKLNSNAHITDIFSPE